MNVTLRFDEEKRQSRRLNEQVLSSSGSCRHEKQTTRDLKLQLSITREENERLKTKLEELTKFSEVLNVKFKMVSLERNKLKEQSEEMSFSVQDSTDRITELGCKLTSKEAFCYLNIPTRKIAERNNMEECIFVYMALHFECRFNRNSLLQY